MAAPEWESLGAYDDLESSAPQITVPTGVQAGDIIVVTFFMDGIGNTVVAAPSGFVEAEGSPVTAANPFNHSLNVWWKRATGADAGTYTFTLSGTAYIEGQANRYSGCVSTGDPWDSPTDGATDDTSGTVTPPVSITTLGPDRTVIHVGTNWTGGTWTPPAGFTVRMQSDLGGWMNGGFGDCYMSDAPQASAGSTGSLTAACDGADKRAAWVGALKPEAAPDPAEGSAALGLDLAVSASGATDAEGAAAVGLALAVSASGAVDREGAAALGLGYAVAAQGGTDAEGAAALGLGYAVAASGSANPGGSVALGLNLAVAATGERMSVGSAALGLGLAVAATGERDAEGSVALGLNFAVDALGPDRTCRVVPAFPGACVSVPSFSEVLP